MTCATGWSLCTATTQQRAESGRTTATRMRTKSWMWANRWTFTSLYYIQTARILIYLLIFHSNLYTRRESSHCRPPTERERQPKRRANALIFLLGMQHKWCLTLLLWGNRTTGQPLLSWCGAEQAADGTAILPFALLKNKYLYLFLTVWNVCFLLDAAFFRGGSNQEFEIVKIFFGFSVNRQNW